MYSKQIAYTKWVIISAMMLLSACGTTDLTNPEQSVNASGQISGSSTTTITESGSIQNVSTCSMVNTNHGINVICGGQLIGSVGGGQISNGSGTEPGEKNPVGCSMIELENNLGYSVTCGDKTGIILNGKDGANGKDGTSCTTTPIPDGSGIYVICDTSAVAIYNGLNGRDGIDGINGTDGKDGQDGIDGINGTDGKDGRDGIDGINGADGKDGQDGIDGVDCKIVTSSDSTLTIACGTDTSTIRATVYNNYTNGTLTSTTFEPVIIYVSSSSKANSSSSAQVSVTPQPNYSYSVEPGVVNGYCGTYYPGYVGWSQTIYHGDSIIFQFDANETASITDILNSVYEWKFPNATTASYAARGNDGIITASVFYDTIGTFYPKLSINGAGYERCSGHVEVKPSLIKNCACTEDTENSTDTHRAWKLEGCSSYAPIVSYTWAGVESSSEDGLRALAPFEYEGQTRVTLKNADSTVKEVACGYILDNSTGYTFNRPGTYYLTYMCNKVNQEYTHFYAETEDSEGMWVTAKTSAEVNESTNEISGHGKYVYYSRLFNASSNGNASGSPIAFILKSGSFKVGCRGYW